MNRHSLTIAREAESLSAHSYEPSDESLLLALADADTRAMELLYERYSALLYSLAYRMVADRQVAEDLLQDAFLSIWRHAITYSPSSGSVRRWLTSIIQHRTIDYLRYMRRHGTPKEINWEEVEQHEDAAFTDVWEEVSRSMRSSLVRECLMLLSYEQRMVIELAYFHGYTQAEIAEKYELPLGTVKARMRLGLLHLKRELEKRGIGEM